MDRLAATEAPKPKRKPKREEYLTHKALAELLDKYIDTSRCFWSSLENRPISWLSGHLQRLRGCKSGLPDLLFLMPGLAVACLELKSRSGRLSKNQKAVRDQLVAVGVRWRMCRSVRSAMQAIKDCGVPFRRPYRERALADWEGPFDHQVTRFPAHSKVREKRREVNRRRRERLRELGIDVSRPRPLLSPEDLRVRNAEKQRKWRERRRAQGLSIDVRKDTPERREAVRQAQARYRERRRDATA
jgi:hypothetical protein